MSVSQCQKYMPVIIFQLNFNMSSTLHNFTEDELTYQRPGNATLCQQITNVVKYLVNNSQFVSIEGLVRYFNFVSLFHSA